jgi:hypothetical protein
LSTEPPEYPEIAEITPFTRLKTASVHQKHPLARVITSKLLETSAELFITNEQIDALLDLL